MPGLYVEPASEYLVRAVTKSGRLYEFVWRIDIRAVMKETTVVEHFLDQPYHTIPSEFGPDRVLLQSGIETFTIIENTDTD